MADAVDLLFYRGIERWMVVVGGLIFAYLGYRLFLYGVDQGNGKLEAENSFFKFTFSGSGPGLFFMAFGGMILMSSVYSTTEWSRTTSTPAAAEIAGAGATPQATVTESKFHFNAPGGEACDYLKLIHNQGDARKALELYFENDNPKVAQLGRSLQPLGDDDLARILPGVEALICN